MAKHSSKTVIGGFVISAILLLIGGVILFGSGKMFEEKVKYVMFFDKSVKGLSAGSSVVCRGVEIGLIIDIVLDIDSDSYAINVPVFAEIYPSRLRVKGKRTEDRDTSIEHLIKRGMRAQLSLESIVTGQMLVEIVFLPDTPANLTGREPGYYEIPTVTSTMDQLTQKLEQLPIQKISETLLSILGNIDKVLGTHEIMDIVRNLDKSSENLVGLIDNADGLVKDTDLEVKTLLDTLGSKIEALSANIETALRDAQSLIKDTDKEIQVVSDDAQKLLKDIDGHIQPLGEEAQGVLVSARQALDEARKTLKDMDGLIGGKSEIRRKLGRSLEEAAAAARSLKSLLDYLERHPESLLKGKTNLGG